MDNSPGRYDSGANSPSSFRRNEPQNDDGYDSFEYSDDEGNFSEEDGEALMDTMRNDYKRDERLDRYSDVESSDEEGEHGLDYYARMNEQMDLVETSKKRRKINIAAALLARDEEDSAPRYVARENADLSGLQNLEEQLLDLESITQNQNVTADLVMVQTQNEIKRRVTKFIVGFTENNVKSYINRVNAMCTANKTSLNISFIHLTREEPHVAQWLLSHPRLIFPLFNEAASHLVSLLYTNLHGLDAASNDIVVRFTDIPGVDSIRDLRQKHLNTLINVTGVVTRRTSVFPQLKLIKFTCMKCNGSNGPFVQNTTQEVKPSRCISCSSSGPFKINMAETVFQNYQKITLQESPSAVQAGRIPRSTDVVLVGDLIDSCLPGQAVSITGVYQHAFDQRSNRLNGFPIFSTTLVCNHLERMDATASSVIAQAVETDDDTKIILSLAKKPNIGQLIMNSIAPSIYGHEHIKSSLALSLFGGVPKKINGNHNLRGSINVLLVGDPGTGKSQFLKYIQEISPGAIYTTGKGSSSVGLTAAVRMDPVSKEWTLEGGALVLADNNICIIDEFDKMSEQDRTSIHEALEQQTISISKAGIMCTLNSRCSVIAAANPIYGKYINTKTFQEQVDLTEPILSRFDCLCVVRDVVDSESDRKLAHFVVGSHFKAHPDAEHDPEDQDNINMSDFSNIEKVMEDIDRLEREKKQIPQYILKKYIQYAKRNCNPTIASIDYNKIIKIYCDLRKSAFSNGGIQITTRHIEAIIRCSEAHAKMHLRNTLNNADIDFGIKIMLDSFISSQKLSIKNILQKDFAKYIYASQDKHILLLDILSQIKRQNLMLIQYTYKMSANEARAHGVTIKVDEFLNQASAIGLTDYTTFLESDAFKNEGYRYDHVAKVIKCVFDY